MASLSSHRAVAEAERQRDVEANTDANIDIPEVPNTRAMFVALEATVHIPADRKAAVRAALSLPPCTPGGEAPTLSAIRQHVEALPRADLLALARRLHEQALPHIIPLGGDAADGVTDAHSAAYWLSLVTGWRPGMTEKTSRALSAQGIAEAQAALLALCDLTPTQWLQEAAASPFWLDKGGAVGRFLYESGELWPSKLQEFGGRRLGSRPTVVDHPDRLPAALLADERFQRTGADLRLEAVRPISQGQLEALQRPFATRLTKTIELDDGRIRVVDDPFALLANALDRRTISLRNVTPDAMAWLFKFCGQSDKLPITRRRAGRMRREGAEEAEVMRLRAGEDEGKAWALRLQNELYPQCRWRHRIDLQQCWAAFEEGKRVRRAAAQRSAVIASAQKTAP
jgi:hypothetical protein